MKIPVALLSTLVLLPAIALAQTETKPQTGESQPAATPGATETKPDSPEVPAATPAAPAIEDGSEVSLEYTLTDDKGELLDSNRGRAPLQFTQGAHQIIPGLESALAGLRAGDEKTVTVAPALGYGETDPSASTEVPKELMPPGVAVGTQLMARTQEGEARLVRVQEIKDATVILDLNHPLAGKTLHFAVKILGVEPPKQ